MTAGQRRVDDVRFSEEPHSTLKRPDPPEIGLSVLAYCPEHSDEDEWDLRNPAIPNEVDSPATFPKETHRGTR